MKNPILFASFTMSYALLMPLILLIFSFLMVINKRKLSLFINNLKAYLQLKYFILIKNTPIIKAQSGVYNSTIGTEKVSTIGGILVDKFKFKYGLGTCHGLKQKFIDNQSEFIGDRDHEIVHKKDDSIIGKLKAILFTDELDIALVRIDGRRKLDAAIADNSTIGNPTAIYTPSVLDEKTLKIVLFSDVQGDKNIEGLVIQSNTSVVIDFTLDGKVQKIMNNLIAISSDLVNGKALTVDGDSGVWVRTKEKNEVIGIVVGAKDTTTYVMKMDTILKACETELNLKLTLLINE
jgi:hypothetical protein